MIGSNVVQATCKLCDAPVSVVTAIHRGLCRSCSQQERIARLERAKAGRPTVEDLLITAMNATRKTYVRKRPCVTCGTLVRENRSPVARCQACFLKDRYGAREKRDMIAVSLRYLQRSSTHCASKRNARGRVSLRSSRKRWRNL